MVAARRDCGINLCPISIAPPHHRRGRVSERELTAPPHNLTLARGDFIHSLNLTRIVLLLVLFFGALVILLPFVWAVSASLTPRELIFAFPPRWFPQPFQWDNYVQALTVLP